MNILVIANGYPTKKSPQYGCFEKDQALALKQLGHNVTVLYLDERFRLYWRKIGVEHKKDNEIDIYSIYLFPGIFLSIVSNRIKYKFDCWLLNVLYKRYIKDCQIKPDIIYAHYLTNIAISVELKKKYDIPLVGIEHWSVLAKNELPSNALFCGKIAYFQANLIIAVSYSLQSHIYRHFGKSSVVVNDMLGSEFCLPHKRKIDDCHFHFIAIGSLVHRKGFDLLLDAFSKSNLANECCTLTIVGEGPERSALLKQISNLALSNSVKLVGRKTKKEIITLLNESDGFVLSSRAETFGVVCIEALSQGVPIIATICGGPEEYVNDKNGILIPPNCIDDMSNALRKMRFNYDTYNRDEISQECFNSFSPSVIANKLTTLFEDVICKCEK